MSSGAWILLVPLGLLAVAYVVDRVERWFYAVWWLEKVRRDRRRR